MADLDLGGKQDDPVVGSTADWLATLSERVRAQGDRERADRFLLLAWQAYDGQDLSLIAADVEGEQAPLVPRWVGSCTEQPDECRSPAPAMTSST